MTDTTRAPDTPPVAEASSAGARLRAARTAAGLSIDTVAQQLKLAPRQVIALENDDFAALPGRTFVRGFVRNYARLLQLDTAVILAALPEGDAAPSLDRPSLATTTRTMGELPADLHAKSSSARWAIPLALVAIIGIAAVYEWSRPIPATSRANPEIKAPVAVAPSTTPLPVAPAPESAPVAPVSATSPSAVDQSKAGVVDSGSAAAVAAPASAPLILVFRGSSWVEIKDSKGAVLLSTMGFPGATHAVDGAPPFDVVIGNAEAVTVTVRGEAFDVGPHIRQNVAKFTVK